MKDRTSPNVVMLCNLPISIFSNELGIDVSAERRFTSWNASLVKCFVKRDDIRLHAISRSNVAGKNVTLRIGPHRVTYLHSSRTLNRYTLLNSVIQPIQEYIGRHRPDIVHGVGTESVWSYIATRYASRNVITVHGILNEIIRKTHPPLLSRMRYFQMMENASLRRADNLIVISQYVEQSVGRKTAARKFVIENPVSTVFFDKEPAPHKSSTIVFVGDLSRRKALDILLKAFSHLIEDDRYRNWRVAVAGPTTPTDYYSQDIGPLLESERLKGRVDLLGFVGPDKLASLYSSSAFLALTSREETAPMCIAEAMAVGIPVIAHRISGIPYMIGHGETGYLVDILDKSQLIQKMSHLMTNASVRKRMGAKAKSEGRRRWHEDTIADQTVGVYREIARSRHRHQ